MASILDYNNALNAYNKTPSATTYNNVLNVTNTLRSGNSASSFNNSQGNTSGGGNNNGSSSSNSGASDDPLTSLADQISTYQSQLAAYNASATAYQQQNPFNFDDILAKAQSDATTALNPYYTEVLGNFMQGVNYMRQNSLQDENRAVTQLQADSDAFTGQTKANLDQALLQAGQAASDAGSYDSGARQRAQGYQNVNANYALQQNARTTAYKIGTQQIASNRLINQTIPLNISNENLQVGQQYGTELAGLTSQNAQNAVNAYYYNEGQKLGPSPNESTLAYQNQQGQLATGGLMPATSYTLPTSMQLPT